MLVAGRVEGKKRWYSEFFGCNELLFELLLSFFQLKAVPPDSTLLSHTNKAFCFTERPLTRYVLSRTILCKKYVYINSPIDKCMYLCIYACINLVIYL